MKFGSRLISLIAVLALGVAPVFARELSVGIEQDQKKITLNSGDLLEIKLPGNRTTGYQWDLVEPKKAMHHLRLTEQGVSMDASKGHPSLMGAPGEDRFLFKVLGGGEEDLSFRYHRPWESEAPARTFILKVLVTRP